MILHILLYKTNGEGELKRMENQVKHHADEGDVSHSPCVNQASSVLCV